MRGGARSCFAYASLDKDHHYLFGGEDTNEHSTRAALEYNFTSQTCSRPTPLPDTTCDSAATAIDEHRLIVVGGLGGSCCCSVYDTRTQSWATDWPDLNIPRFGHACVCTNNKIYVLGGYRNGVIDSIEELDVSLATPSWRILPQRLTTKRTEFCAAVDPNNPNNIIVVGGHDEEFNKLTSCEILSLETGRTRTIPSLTTPRHKHMMVVVEKRFLVVIGGFHLSSVEVLDLDEEPQEWRLVPSMKTARSEGAAFYSATNRTIVVAGGSDGRKRVDTIEELQVRLWDPVRFRRRRFAHSNNALRRPPPLQELPAGLMDPTHRRKIQRWLVEIEEQMTGFVATVNTRERELVQERQDLLRICDDYVAHVNAQQDQARAILGCIPDASPTGNPTNVSSGLSDGNGSSQQNLRRPPPLTKIPAGHMDETHKREIELWIEESERCKNSFVVAVDTREAELDRELRENRRVCNEYVANVRGLQRKARRLITVDVSSNGPPHELLCPITLEVMVDPVMTADGQTYERAAIERVFENTAPGEDPRSPVTGLLLSSRLLIPNVALRRICMDYEEDSRA